MTVHKPPNAALAERVLMALLLGGIAVGCVMVLYPFFSALLWAAILVYSTWPVFAWLRSRARLGRIGAALVMVVLTAVLIVVPLVLAAPEGGDDITQLRASLQDLLLGGLPAAPAWLHRVPLAGPVIADYWNAWSADLSAMEAFFRPYLGMIAESGLQLLYVVAKGIAHFLLALFIAFFFWWAGEAMAEYLAAIMHRIAGGYADRLLEVTGRTVRGTVYGVLGTAFVQGILTGFGLYLAGVPRALLLGAVAGFLAVLPIGAPLVWIPCGLWLLSLGHTGRGIFLLIYGVVAVSGADHLIRPYFIARGAQLPFLVTMLGVLGGALAFGFLGIFLGPVLLGVGFTLVAEFARDGRPGPDGEVWR
jgi:predicted PurR-regulated permease PerM